MSNPEPESWDHPLPGKALKELFVQSHDRGRAGLPVMSLSMKRGLVPRNQDERRVETNLGDEGHRLVRAGELAYNMMRMWQGVCSLAEEDCLISPAYVVVRPLDGTEPKFAEYLLTYEETVAQFRRLSFGVVDDRLRLYYKDFQRVRVSVPSPAAQRKIAKILAVLDNLIERTEALIAKYQAVKQGIMQILFTRGVGRNGLLRPSHGEAPHLYEPSRLGWIPKGWICCELGLVVPRAEYGISVSLDDADGLPVLRMNNLADGKVDLTDLKFSRSIGARRLTLKDRDVLFNRTNSFDQVGRTSIWRNEALEASFASYLVRLVPNFDKLLPEYLVYWLNLPETQIAIRQFATPGVHQVNINPTNLRRSSIRLPTELAEQAAICRIIDQRSRVIDAEHQYLAKLRLQKSGLMQDLLSGKVRVHVDPAEEDALA